MPRIARNGFETARSSAGGTPTSRILEAGEFGASIIDRGGKFSTKKKLDFVNGVVICYKLICILRTHV
jgi:hypothetical protein